MIGVMKKSNVRVWLAVFLVAGLWWIPLSAESGVTIGWDSYPGMSPDDMHGFRFLAFVDGATDPVYVTYSCSNEIAECRGWLDAAPGFHTVYLQAQTRTGEMSTPSNRLTFVVDGDRAPETEEPLAPQPPAAGGNVPLSLACPSDLTVTGSGRSVVDYQPAAVIGGVAPIQVAYNPPSGSTFSVGANIVRVTASDMEGHTAACEFSIAVELAPPPASAPPDAERPTPPRKKGPSKSSHRPPNRAAKKPVKPLLMGPER